MHCIFRGTIGDILYRRSEISFNGRFVQDYETNEIEFMYPTYFDKVCVIAPKALEIPVWVAPFLCFTPGVWLIIVLLNFICGYIWYLLKKLTVKRMKLKMLKIKDHEKYNPEYNKFIVVTIEMWRILTSSPSTQMPVRTTERLFMTSCLLTNIILAGIFQGSLTKSFSTTSFYKDINTLDELDKSRFPIGVGSKSLLSIFDDDGSTLLKSLKYKLFIGPGKNVDRTATKRDACSIERFTDIEQLIKVSYQNRDGSPKLHIIAQCPQVYYLSYIVKQGWPFLTRFDLIFQRFEEAGLNMKWYDLVEISIIAEKKIKDPNIIPPEDNPFNLEDMQIAFYLLIVGLCFCVLVFMWEVYSIKPNGGCTIGDVLYRRADISFNARFIQDYRTDEIEFLYPIYFDKVCVIAPKALEVPLWLSIFLCFSSNVWISFVLMNFVCSITWYVLKKFTAEQMKLKMLKMKDHEKYNPEYNKLIVITIEMWRIFTSSPSTQMPFRTTERLFLSTCLLANVILVGIFQGSLTKLFSTTSFYKDINTLEELDKSGLHIGVRSRSMVYIFDDDQSKFFASLRKKLFNGPGKNIDRTAHKRDSCSIERFTDIEQLIKVLYQNHDGSPQLHIIPQCPRVFYLAFIAKEGWPFLKKFSSIFQRFEEAGLNMKWYEFVEVSIITEKKINDPDIIPPEDKPFNIKDMQISFYFLIVGLVLCLLVFLWEIYSWKRSCNFKWIQKLCWNLFHKVLRSIGKFKSKL